MNTNTYTNEMTKLAICAAIAATAIALLIPTLAHAKATGDTIGAATKPALTGASRADMADAPSTPMEPVQIAAPATVAKGTAPVATITHATTTATTTLTRSEQRALIRQLIAEIERLQKLINAMKK